MSHLCEDCGETFETLTRRRLHDCSTATASTAETAASPEADETALSDVEDRRPPAVTITALDDLLDDVTSGEVNALYQAIATYEEALASAQEAGATDEYRGISRAYREPLINALDDATRAEGWPFLEGFIEAYHSATTEDFPHVTTILQNVTGPPLGNSRV